MRCAVSRSRAASELVSVLTLCEGVARRLDRVTVDAVAALERRGVRRARLQVRVSGAE